MGISLWLLVQSLRGAAMPGCSADAGCASVLGSRWSTWLGLPVSAGAVGVYALLLAATWKHHQVWAQRLLSTLAVVLLGCAAWFVVLQLVVVEAICVYCMAAHSLGVIVAVVIVIKHRHVTMALGLLPVAALILGQWLYIPPTKAIDTPSQFAGFTNLDPSQYPTLGPADAPVAVAYLYDANCPQCRLNHGYLRHAREAFGDQLVVAMMPTPFAKDCNPFMSHTRPEFETSCDLARLTLAVHAVDPVQFDAFDDYLFEDPAGPAPSVADARAFAETLVDPEALDAALADPALNATLFSHAQLFNFLGRGVPRYIVAGRAYPALASAQDLMNLLTHATPLQSPVAP